MASTTTTGLTDDRDGGADGDADGAAQETVSFGLDGVAYEIELGAADAARLRDDLAHWVGHARRTSRRGAGPRRAADRERTAAVRAWARETGMTVAERGRIPAAVVRAYDEAH